MPLMGMTNFLWKIEVIYPSLEIYFLVNKLSFTQCCPKIGSVNPSS
jgi:hypothetical protein